MQIFDQTSYLMKELLEESKQQLVKPLGQARRKLVIILNVAFFSLAIYFLMSEKLSTGSAVPHPSFYLVYIPGITLNFLSAVYNYLVYRHNAGRQIRSGKLWSKIVSNHKEIDLSFNWISFLPVLLLSFLVMIGYNNPSNDSILYDFAFGHSLIIGVVMILGRKAAFAWFLIVVAALFYKINDIGWNYQYHYLTPTEAARYENALAKQESWALARKQELEKSGLNPPQASRYFNSWIVFIIISFCAAFFFSGITIDILKIVPSVINNIENAIQSSMRINMELEQKRNEATTSAMRIVRYNEMLDTIQKELDKLDFSAKKNLVGVTKVLRQSLEKEEAWQSFEINFDSLYGNFFKMLQEKYPDLSQSETKHLSYIKINLSNSEIARLMDVKMESLRTLRYRLKKKLNLSDDIDLKDFVDNLDVF
jgi:DNA-binding CsgD family transcriptional regulator